MIRHRSYRTLLAAFLVAVPAFLFSCPAFGQDRAADISAYLEAAGLASQAHALEQQLLETLQNGEPAMPRARQENMAKYFAFVLTLSGITAEKVRRLQAGGVDVLHAITADARPLMEQALMADLVIEGEVIDVRETPAPGDGFRSSLVVRVRRSFKGIAPGDTVVIRQRSGLAEGERRARDLLPEVGETYVLLLSNGMYRFFLARQAAGGAAVAEATQARHFVIYRWYRMEGERLLWDNYSPEQTERALQEVQWLDELMESL